MMKQLILIFHFALFSTLLKGQEYRICNDTNLVEFKTLEVGNMKLSVCDFKRELANGKWYYYKTKNCRKKNLDDYLKVEGEFLDSARNGSFKYYYSKSPQTRIKRQLYISLTYKAGQLDGEFIIYASNGTKLYSGFFVKGKMDGFFIEYDWVKMNNTIRQIDYYINDTLQYSSKYNEKGELRRK